MAILAPLAGVVGGGGIFGNLALAALSFGASIALAYFFPQKVKGPRAENLKAQTSRYGDHISRTYGTTRVAGAVIWLKNDQVDEHESTHRPGKALGPEVTEFSYTADFAVALTWNGPVHSVPRIWADDKLIYDQSAESLEAGVPSGEDPEAGVVKGADITIYLGTDDQMPDPHIEADRGVGQVPAWRGICYVVIRNLPLDEFGIRVPNIEAEVVRVGEDVLIGMTPESVGTSPWNTDINRGMYANVLTGVSDGDLVIGSLPSGDTVFSGALSYPPDGCHITERGEVVVGDRNDDALYIYDGNSGALEQTVAVLPSDGTAQLSVMDDITILGITYLMVWRGFRLTLLENDGTGYVVTWAVNGGFTTVLQIATMSLGPEYAYCVRANSKQITLVAWTDVGSVISTVTLSVSGTEIVSATYDEDSDSVIVITDDASIYVFEPDLSSELRSVVNPSGSLSAIQDPMRSKRLKSGTDIITVKLADNTVREYRVSTLELVQEITPQADWPGFSNGQYAYAGIDPTWRVIATVGHTGTAPLRLWFLPRAQRGGEPLPDVIEAECALAGLECDVSELDPEDLVLGYGIREGTPPRGVIEDLARIKQFDFAHVDGITKFFYRTSESARTLVLAEMGMSDGDGEPLQVREEYPDHNELPAGVVVRYPAWDATYRTGTQAVSAPDGYDDTLGSLEIDTSLVMTDEEAVHAADIIFNETRNVSKRYFTKLGPKHLDLHPGDVLTIPLDTDRSVRGVLDKQAGETVLEMEFRHRDSAFTSEAVPNPVPNPRPPALSNRAQTVFLPIDGHLLRSNDNDDSFYSGVYKRERGSFVSSVVYRSADSGATYRPWAAFAGLTVRGIAQSALPDRPHPWAWDRASSLIVSVPLGTFPSSVTEDELLADETVNAFAVKSGTEWEYLRAASVIDNGDGTYTLSTLLRGRKGTEFAMPSHAQGDTVVHLNENVMQRAPEGDRTLSRKYVATSTGTRFDATTAVTFTNNGRGLRPWSPVNLRATRDGSDNISGTFSRRDRLGQSWPDDGPEDPPMSEAAESYKIYVYDTDGETVLRTITSATETWSYSAANQSTDFGAPVAEGDLDVGIVQVSATYGDGIEARAML